MTEYSTQHAYIAWTKNRLDEMDVVLASLETKAGQLKADAKAKATKLIADLKERRGAFETESKAHLKAGEAALEASKAQLEKQWTGFEAELKTYLETVAKDIDQKRATFADVAAAHAKAWAEAAETFQSAAAKLGAEHKVKADKAIAQIRADANEAKAHLAKLSQEKQESWAALSAALQVSRKKFDEASQGAWEALKTAATSPKK